MHTSDIPMPATCDAGSMQRRVEQVTALKRAYWSYPAVMEIEEDLNRLLLYGAVGGRTGTSASTYMLLGESGVARRPCSLE